MFQNFPKIFSKIFELCVTLHSKALSIVVMKVMTVDNGFEETAFENGREAFWQLEGRFFMKIMKLQRST